MACYVLACYVLVWYDMVKCGMVYIEMKLVRIMFCKGCAKIKYLINIQ